MGKEEEEEVYGFGIGTISLDVWIGCYFVRPNVATTRYLLFAYRSSLAKGAWWPPFQLDLIQKTVCVCIASNAQISYPCTNLKWCYTILERQVNPNIFCFILFQLKPHFRTRNKHFGASGDCNNTTESANTTTLSCTTHIEYPFSHHVCKCTLSYEFISSCSFLVQTLHSSRLRRPSQHAQSS